MSAPVLIAVVGTTLVLVLLGLLAATLLLRRTDRGARFWALPAKAKLTFGRSLLADSRTPRLAKLGLLLLVGYLLMPFDLIPDFIPVLGQLDDLLVAGATIALLFLLVSPVTIDAALSRSEDPGKGASHADPKP